MASVLVFRLRKGENMSEGLKQNIQLLTMTTCEIKEECLEIENGEAPEHLSVYDKWVREKDILSLLDEVATQIRDKAYCPLIYYRDLKIAHFPKTNEPYLAVGFDPCSKRTCATCTIRSQHLNVKFSDVLAALDGESETDKILKDKPLMEKIRQTRLKGSKSSPYKPLSGEKK